MMAAKGKPMHATCASVIRKEREIYDAIIDDKKAPKSCLISKWSPQKIKCARHYYLLTDEISEMGIPIDTVYECIPKAVVINTNQRHGFFPHSLKRNSPIRKKMIDFIYKCCSNNEYISQKIMRKEFGTTEEMTDDEIKTHANPKAACAILAVRAAKRKSLAALPTPPKVVFKQHPLKIECDTIYRNVLTRVMKAGYGDSEYAAFAHVMKWAGERLDAEQQIPST